MIESLHAKAYKSFDNLDLSVSNINVLLGSNSSGKSSITNLLLMLSQTSSAYHNYDSILRLNGDKTSLGESINLFPDKNSDKKIQLGWGLDDSSIDKQFNQLHLIDIFDEIYSYIRMSTISLRREDLFDMDSFHNAMMKIDEVYSSMFYNEDSLSDYDKAVDFKVEIARILKPILRLHRNEKAKGSRKNRHKVEVISLPRLNELIDFLVSSDGENRMPKSISYVIVYNSAQEECELKKVTVFNKQNQVVIEVSVSGSNKIDLLSDIIPLDVLSKSRLDIVRGMDLKNFILLDDNFTANSVNPFASYVRGYVSSVLKFFSSEISGNKLNHVSPLRAFPQRYYLLEKSAQHDILSSNDGSQLAEVLKNNPSVLDKVNELFKDFGIKISTAKTNDIIHRITVKQNNVTVELTDVGFGISQVLPVIVQALLSPKDSLTIIEQPEIHLHPKMQAWLTNALVSISMREDKRFVIETHSDTIIRRLQILLLDPEVNFNKKNLNIYHLERDDLGKTQVKNVFLNEIGEISWPKGFMDVEINDSIRLQRLKVNKIKEIKEMKEVKDV